MGTKQENDGQSNTSEQDVTNDDAEFNNIAKALNDGDYASLDRLMAAEASSKPKEQEQEEEKDPPKSLDQSDESDESDDSNDEQKLTDDSNKNESDEEDGTKTETDTGKPDKETDSSDPEAAKSAASTAKTDMQALEQELHRLRSDAGRVPYMQRKLAEVERELRAYKARTPNASTDGKTQATAPDLNSIELDKETQKEIDDLKETDPVLARTLERIAKNAIATAMSRDNHVIDTFTKADEEAENERFFLEQKAELTRLIPQHEQVFALPEWRQWKESLTPGLRAMAESGLASEVSQAIYAFAADMQRRAAPAATGQNQQVTPPASQTSEVQEERARKVATSSEAKQPAAKKSQELDEDAYFAEMYNKIGKANNILP